MEYNVLQNALNEGDFELFTETLKKIPLNQFPEIKLTPKIGRPSQIKENPAIFLELKNRGYSPQSCLKASMEFNDLSSAIESLGNSYIMEYFAKKYFILSEFAKIKSGYFTKGSAQDVNKARYIAEIKDIYMQAQFRGISYGLAISVLSLARFKMLASLIFNTFLMFAGRELMTMYYIDDFYESLVKVQDFQ